VRHALDFDPPYAIPVVSPKLTKRPPRPSPTIIWRDYDPEDVGKTTLLFPTWAKDDPDQSKRTLPTLHPKESLAILAATGDSRLTEAVLRTAKKPDIKRESVATAARRLAIEPPSRRLHYPNSIVLLKWLLRFAETARAMSAKERMTQDLLGGGPAGYPTRRIAKWRGAWSPNWVRHRRARHCHEGRRLRRLPRQA